MTNFKISKRLKLIAEMVNEKSSIIDVGCDHALLDIYLSKNNIIKKAIASDVVEGAINQAKKNVLKYDVKNVEVRLADGLECLNEKDKIDTIIMSGLGNQKIINILKKDLTKLKKIKNIIIQSNTGYDSIRKEVIKLGYYIEDEALIEDNKIIYVIIKFAKGNKKYTKKDIYYGPILKQKKSKLFYKLIKNEIEKKKNILNKLPKNRIFKKIKIKIKINKLKKEIR